MYIGTGYAKIRIYDAYSKKDRRQIVNSLVTRLRNKYNVSVSILDDGEVWNIAEIGMAAVSASTQIIRAQFDQIEDILYEDFRFEVLELDTDLQ